jgi:protein-S-isoprenylcysteine O-methyltransferase Ste14
MEIIGKTPINPLLFITGKLSGYLTWIFLLISLIRIELFPFYSNPAVRIIAPVILAVGLVFIITSSFSLGKSVRLGLPKTETVLKQSGIYKFSRNPMYVGFDLLTLSSMIYTFYWIVIILGVYSIMTYHLIIRGEENFLTDRFGEQYLTYKRKVRRYV